MADTEETTTDKTETVSKPGSGNLDDLLRGKPAQAEQPDAETPETGADAKGSKTAVLADLATERDKRQALEAQFNGLRDGLAKALGLGEPDEVTPEQLAEQLTASQQEAQTARAELAVFRAAPDGVDAQALLDSRAFASVVAKLDVSDGEAVSKAIDDFVKANPRFAAPVRQYSPGSRDAGAGGSADTGVESMDDLIRSRRR